MDEIRAGSRRLGLDASRILCLNTWISLTLFLLRGAQISLGTSPFPIEWTPISRAFSELFRGMSEGWQRSFGWTFLWAHLLLVLGFLVYLPYSKHLHIATAAVNVFFARTRRRGRLAGRARGAFPVRRARRLVLGGVRGRRRRVRRRRLDAAGRGVSVDPVAILTGVRGAWVYVAVGAGALLESAAFIGLVVPGETVMLLAGVVAALGGVDLAAVMAVGAVGAVLGDQLGYLLGQAFGSALRRGHFGGRTAERWARAEELVVIERFLSERGVTRCPDVGTIQLAPPPVPRGSIPRADVAAVIAALLDNPGTRHQTLELVGGDSPIAAAVQSIS